MVLLAAALVLPALAGCQPLAAQVQGGAAAGIGGQAESQAAAAPPAVPGAAPAAPEPPVEAPTDGTAAGEATAGEVPAVEAPAAEAPGGEGEAGDALAGDSDLVQESARDGNPTLGRPADSAEAQPGEGSGATGGSSTGGYSTGSASTGGASTGGSSTGGSSTGSSVVGSSGVGGSAAGGSTGSAAGGSTAASTGNPLAGDRLHGPNAGAAEAAAQLAASRPADAALLEDMARVPTATWLGSWLPDVTSAVQQRVAEARAAGGVPVFVAYNVPNLDCGGHSASGGAGSASAYETWIRAVAAGIGSAEAVVVVEPDTLTLLCGSADERLGLLRTAVQVLEANPTTHTYLDAGHSNWIDVSTTAERLRAAGVGEADGFALNVSNFEATDDNVAFGAAVSAALGGAHFVVDTSRNGNGPGDHWCNPSGRALGEHTTTQTGHPLVDAFVWIKTPGESDGACNGGPAAGRFWTDYAVGLARG